MENRNGMLYPMMIIAAVSVVLFSVVGIATMTGHIPSVLSQKSDGAAESQAQAEKGSLAAKEADETKLSQKAKTAPAHPGTERRAAPAPQRTATACADCGVVESVQAQEIKGQGTGIGAVGGAVVGGVLGHQVGSGRGNDLATVAGAIGGGFAGNEVEKNVKKTSNYVIRVRMEDGSYRTVTQASQPAVVAGDRVRIDNGNIVARG